MNRNMARIGLIISALALSVAGVATAAAQDRGGECPHGGQHARGPGGHHHMDPERRLAHLTERLHLSEQQATQIRAAFTREMQDRHANRPAPGAPEARRAAHEQFRERMAQQIDAVLTPAQRAEFARMRAEHEQRREQHRRDFQRGAERGPQRDPV